MLHSLTRNIKSQNENLSLINAQSIVILCVASMFGKMYGIWSEHWNLPVGVWWDIWHRIRNIQRWLFEARTDKANKSALQNLHVHRISFTMNCQQNKTRHPYEELSLHQMQSNADNECASVGKEFTQRESTLFSALDPLIQRWEYLRWYCSWCNR